VAWIFVCYASVASHMTQHIFSYISDASAVLTKKNSNHPPFHILYFTILLPYIHKES
jgi:hypothetical protein